MIKRGTLTKLSSETGYSRSYLCDLAAGRKRAGRKRALVLEEACQNIGIKANKELWIFGTSDEIKSALSNMAKTEPE